MAHVRLLLEEVTTKIMQLREPGRQLNCKGTNPGGKKRGGGSIPNFGGGGGEEAFQTTIYSDLLQANYLPEVRSFVRWCFEPSQPQRITSGLYTIFTLSQSYSFHKSSYHKSCFLSLLIFRGHSTREPTSGRVTYFILQAYTGTMC